MFYFSVLKLEHLQIMHVSYKVQDITCNFLYILIGQKLLEMLSIS